MQPWASHTPPLTGFSLDCQMGTVTSISQCFRRIQFDHDCKHSAGDRLRSSPLALLGVKAGRTLSSLAQNGLPKRMGATVSW